MRVATTGNDSELVKTLPITRRPGAAERVVISMSPGVLPDLVAGDRLRVTAELQVTNNCNFSNPRCVGPVYHYAPMVRARLVLAADEDATGGRRTLCVGARPARDLHSEAPRLRAPLRARPSPAAGSPSAIPGACRVELDRCRINLVADAHHPRAGCG